MFDFYNLFFKEGYLKLEDLKEATKWNVISREEFKIITGQGYIEGIEMEEITDNAEKIETEDIIVEEEIEEKKEIEHEAEEVAQ